MVVREEEHAAVSRRGLEGLGCDLATGARLVFDHHRGAQGILELVGHHPRNRVCAAAWRKTHQQLHGAVVGLRATGAQRGDGQHRLGYRMLQCHADLQKNDCTQAVNGTGASDGFKPCAA